MNAKRVNWKMVLLLLGCALIAGAQWAGFETLAWTIACACFAYSVFEPKPGRSFRLSRQQ